LDLPDRLHPKRGDEDDGDRSEDDLSLQSAVTTTNARSLKNVRSGRKKDDSDSEFEFDM
jgi:hypothetical protein